MNASVGSAIEKIKLQEQDNNNKLKEIREYEAAVANLTRAIKEATQCMQKSQVEHEHSRKNIDTLRCKLLIKKTRRDALLAQVQVSKLQLEELRSKLEQDISKVWGIRSNLCTAVQAVANDCDIRALLVKPMCPDFVTTHTNKSEDQDYEQPLMYEERLKAAIERRNKAIRERDQLQSEPDSGEEFIRIRNALQYSLEMVSKHEVN